MAGWNFQKHRKTIMGEAETYIETLLEAHPELVPIRHTLTTYFRIVGDLAGEVGYNAAQAESGSTTVTAGDSAIVGPWTSLSVGLVG